MVYANGTNVNNNYRYREYWLPNEISFSNMKTIIVSIIIGCLVTYVGMSLVANNDPQEYVTSDQLKKFETQLYQLEERLLWQDEKIDSLQFTTEANNQVTYQMPQQAVEIEVAPQPVEVKKKEKSLKPKEQTHDQKGIAYRYHQVRNGDTLYRISLTYGVSIKDIQQLNRMSPEDSIHPGQRLLIGQTER